MRVLAIGDPHFRISNVRDAQLFRAKIVEMIKRAKPRMVVILGDLHNDFERIHSTVMREICLLFNAIADAMETYQADPYLYYIVGNHDMINNQVYLTDDHAFVPFHAWKDVTIVDQPLLVKEGEFSFCMMPYVPPGRFMEALGNIPEWRSVNAIFCHQEFRGVQLGPKASTQGDEYPADAPRVISGHIHDQQILQGNIIYVGSPFCQTFGEEADKTIGFFDFKDGNVEYRRIDLGMPKRITVIMTIDELKAYEKPDNAYVRVYVTGTTEELHAFKKTKKYKELSQTLKIIPKPSDPMAVRKNETGRGYHDILTDMVSAETEAVRSAYQEVLDAIDPKKLSSA